MRTTPRPQPRSVALAVVMIVSGVGGLFLASSPASAVLVTTVNSVQGSAYGASSTLGLIPLAATPGGVSITAPPATCPATVPGDTVGVNLGAVEVGVVHADTHCEPALPSVNGFVTSNADVAFVGIGATGALATGLRIDGVHAVCRSGRQADGSVHSTGATTVASISTVVAGLPVSLPINIGNLGPNTSVTEPLTSLLGISLFLNEQTPADSFSSPTQITVNAVRVHSTGGGLLGSILGPGDLIVGHVQCRADFTTVDVTTTTAAPATTTTTVAGTTSTTAAATTTTTVASTTSTTAATTTTTVAATTTTTAAATTTTTSPPTGTVATTTTTVPTAVSPQTLVRTGSNLLPLAVLSVLSIVLGMLLLIGSGRPLAANVGGSVAVGGMYGDGTPEKWGPVEIAKTIWAGFAALLMMAAKLFKRD